MFGIAQGRRLGVNLAPFLADIGVAQNAKPFGEGSHHSVFNAVMDHLYEVARAVRAAVQITLLRCAAEFLASRRARDASDTRRQRGKNGIQALNHCPLPADHHAVAPFQSPDAATRSDIDVMNSFEFLCAPDVVHVIRVAAVNERIARFEKRQNVGNSLVHDRGWNHQPDRTRLIQFLHQVRQRGSTDGSFFGQVLDRFGNPVKNDAPMARIHKSSNHVGAHPPESHHSELCR